MYLLPHVYSRFIVGLYLTILNALNNSTSFKQHTRGCIIRALHMTYNGGRCHQQGWSGITLNVRVNLKCALRMARLTYVCCGFRSWPCVTEWLSATKMRPMNCDFRAYEVWPWKYYNVWKLHRPRMSHGLLADCVDTSLASLLYSCTTDAVFSEMHDQSACQERRA